MLIAGDFKKNDHLHTTVPRKKPSQLAHDPTQLLEGGPVLVDLVKFFFTVVIKSVEVVVSIKKVDSLSRARTRPLKAVALKRRGFKTTARRTSLANS